MKVTKSSIINLSMKPTFSLFLKPDISLYYFKTKKYLGWFSGDRTTAPSLLVRALYRRDHRAALNQPNYFFARILCQSPSSHLSNKESIYDTCMLLV